jgi:hypothetical protein
MPSRASVKVHTHMALGIPLCKDHLWEGTLVGFTWPVVIAPLSWPSFAALTLLNSYLFHYRFFGDSLHRRSVYNVPLLYPQGFLYGCWTTFSALILRRSFPFGIFKTEFSFVQDSGLGQLSVIIHQEVI